MTVPRAVRSAEHGFTLVELMVVIAIIGIASAAVVLMMPDPRGRLADEADQFAARVRVAHDAAILNARTTSVWERCWPVSGWSRCSAAAP